jgi:hypothetical protein
VGAVMDAGHRSRTTPTSRTAAAIPKYARS